MAHDGKIENWGSGSRRSPQPRAERAARRSQKRAEARREQDYVRFAAGEMESLPERDNVMDAMALLHVAAWEFGRACRDMARETEGLCR